MWVGGVSLLPCISAVPVLVLAEAVATSSYVGTIVLRMVSCGWSLAALALEAQLHLWFQFSCSRSHQDVNSTIDIPLITFVRMLALLTANVSS